MNLFFSGDSLLTDNINPRGPRSETHLFYPIALIKLIVLKPVLYPPLKSLQSLFRAGHCWSHYQWWRSLSTLYSSSSHIRLSLVPSHFGKHNSPPMINFCSCTDIDFSFPGHLKKLSPLEPVSIPTQKPLRLSMFHIQWCAPLVSRLISKANIMIIADRMSRMPGRYSQNAVAVDLERIVLLTTHPTDAADPEHPSKKVPEAESHRTYRDSQWYGKIARYLLDGEEVLENCGRTEKRAVKRQSQRYKLTDQHLPYVETGGSETAKCALPWEIGSILKWVHSDHGHFSSPLLTLYKLQGQWHWPSRSSDVERC